MGEEEEEKEEEAKQEKRKGDNKRYPALENLEHTLTTTTKDTRRERKKLSGDSYRCSLRPAGFMFEPAGTAVMFGLPGFLASCCVVPCQPFPAASPPKRKLTFFERFLTANFRPTD